MKDYCVYILSNSAGTLYIGVTSNLDQRIFDHFDGRDPKSFAFRYNLNRLIFVETYPDARQAIAREKQLKGWSRQKTQTYPRTKSRISGLFCRLWPPSSFTNHRRLILRQAQDDRIGNET